MEWSIIDYVKNAVNLSKTFIIIKPTHAHLQYVCNIHAKYLKDTLNTLGGVDFAKYTLSGIIQICTVVKNWLS